MSDSKIGARLDVRQHPAERQRSRVGMWEEVAAGGWDQAASLRATFFPVRCSSWRMRLRA
jgi:hypothetical protein